MNSKQTTLHYHVVDTLRLALEEVFIDGKYADKVIERAFKANRKWGSRDRKFFAETMYEVVRHKRRLEFIADSEDLWDIIGAYLIEKNMELPRWDEFEDLSIVSIQRRISAEKPTHIECSFPDWMHELGQSEFKGEWPALMKSLNLPAEVFLRTNTLKADPEKLLKQLLADEITSEIVGTDGPQANAIRLKVRKNVFATEAFKRGFFEVQDMASQFVAPMLDVGPGMRVADACAGAGGKSLHMAMLMKNKGKIIAMDIHEWKLKELKTRAARNGVDIIETKLIDSTKTIKRLEKSFDRVLLDVPCSGLGVIRRNPDTKWKLSIEEIERLVNLQREILSGYSKMCKPGGKLIYATCSILHRENEEQVKWFLNSEEGKNWTLEKELRVWPHKDGFDGFYAARLSLK